jgi:FAD/FMN-containing dehydrogenase
VDLLPELAAITGAEHVLTDPDLVAGYATDWTRRYRGPARCVVRPASTAEVSQVLRATGRHGVPVVPQGGNTGLVGGGVPSAGHAGNAGAGQPVVLSTRRLSRLDPVDVLSGQVTAGAGVTIAALRAHAAAAGLEYGVDLASRDSATVGGTIATNAGGVQTIRYGGTRAQVLGVEAVLADGSVISRLNGLRTDNTGYDLSQLLVGSEGTLAVITAARLRLWPSEPPLLTVLAGVGSIAEGVDLLASIHAAVPGIRLSEYFEAPGLALVRAHTGLPAPLPAEYPAYVLAEAAGPQGKTEEYAERLVAIPDLEEASVAVDPAGRDALRAYRERHTESISAAGIPHKLDVAMPPNELAGFRAGLDKAVGDAQAIVFGHVGVGNLHVNVLGPDPDDGSVDDAVLRLAADHNGTISAEHGIGRAKVALVHLCRSEPEIAAMRALKSALDPAGLMNPGVLFAS